MKGLIKSACLVAGLALLLASCSSPLASTGTASVHLVLRAPAARAILPDPTFLDTVMALYTARLSRTGYPDITASSATPSLSIDNLVPGAWDIAITAFDAAGNPVARGASSIVAVAGSVVTSAAIQLQWDQLQGTGSVEITLFFPTLEGIDGVEATLRGSFTKAIPVLIETENESLQKVVISDPAVAVGTPLLSVSLSAGGVVKAVMQEAVWVFRNLPTKATRSLISTDFGQPPAAPTWVTIALSAEGFAQLSWTSNSIVADDYVVERAPGATGPWTRIDDPFLPDPAELSHLDSQVSAPAAWHYRVAAENRFGRSDWALGSLAMRPSIAVIQAFDSDGAYYEYWKDGQLSPLDTIPGDDHESFTDIATTGSDVFVSGYVAYYDGSFQTYPYYWKNGTALPLSIDHSSNMGRALTVLADGGDLYLAGFKGDVDNTSNTVVPVFWKNEVSQYLSLDGTDRYGNLVSFSSGQASAIVVKDGNIYIAGSVYDNPNERSLPVYWLNGVLKVLDFGTATDGWATGVAVTEADLVYVIGTLAEASGNQGVFWEGEDLNHPFLGSASYSSVRDIAASGNDVYMAGALWTNPDFPSPVYWKNGVTITRLDKGGYPIGLATGIATAGGSLHLSGALAPDANFNAESHPSGSAVLWADGEIEYLDGLCTLALAPIDHYELAPGLWQDSQQIKIVIDDGTQVGFGSAPLLVLDSMDVYLYTDFVGDYYDWYVGTYYGNENWSGGQYNSDLTIYSGDFGLGRHRVTLFVERGGIEYSGSMDFEIVHDLNTPPSGGGGE